MKRRKIELPPEIQGFEGDPIEFYRDLGFEELKERHLVYGTGLETDIIEGILPEGWTEKANGHYWVDLLDENGNERFSMFVKRNPWYDYSFFGRV